MVATSGLPQSIATAVASAKAELAAAGNKGVIVTGLPSVAAQKMALVANANSVVMDAVSPKMTRQGSASQVARWYAGCYQRKCERIDYSGS